jgi:hypothetical protein
MSKTLREVVGITHEVGLDALSGISKKPITRQSARTFTFDAQHVPYVNWQKIGDEAYSLQSHIDVRRDTDGGLTITLYRDKEQV